MANVLRTAQRSFTGHHNLLPAIKPDIPLAAYTQHPTYSILAWTFGSGSVIWTIWPAVLLHTIFAATVVSLNERNILKIAIPNIMLTVLGVVIGFVISYRALSGYERYWMGRSVWSDIIRNCRTAGRMIWFHVPARLSPKTAHEVEIGHVERSSEELLKAMAEKRMALDLVLGYAVALKHHLRGETGIYYEDLYDLVRPLHDHDHTASQKAAIINEEQQGPPQRAHRIASNTNLPQAKAASSASSLKSKAAKFFGEHEHHESEEPESYGTFPAGQATTTATNNGVPRHAARRVNSSDSTHQPLAPAQNPQEPGLTTNVDMQLVPFAGMFASISRWFSGDKGYEKLAQKDPYGPDASQRKWAAPLQPRVGSDKHKHVMDPELGENLPLEILRCLSEWCSVLEDRGTGGTGAGGLMGCISSFEDNLAALERILTTPLPFVYSVHIRHTVWIYLFFLPFQLVTDFTWYTIPGVSIAAFIYLGFLAAGEEIEQPFGYDENDLDLDMFCQEIIRPDVEALKKAPCLNSYIPPPQQQLIRHRSMTLIEATSVDGSESEHHH